MEITIPRGQPFELVGQSPRRVDFRAPPVVGKEERRVAAARRREGAAAGALRGERASWTYVGLLLLASVPAGLAGVLARDWFESAFGSPVVAALMLLVTGFIDGELWPWDDQLSYVISQADAGRYRFDTGQQLIELEVAADPRVSPDGTQVVYARRFADRLAELG